MIKRNLTFVNNVYIVTRVQLHQYMTLEKNIIVADSEAGNVAY
jgi:hypothetical protein